MLLTGLFPTLGVDLKTIPSSDFPNDPEKLADLLNRESVFAGFELGRTYAVMGKTAEARKFINQGLAMLDTEKDDPETKRQGREILQQLH